MPTLCWGEIESIFRNYSDLEEETKIQSLEEQQLIEKTNTNMQCNKIFWQPAFVILNPTAPNISDLSHKYKWRVTV